MSEPGPDLAWIDTALTAARPQAVAAMLRYFRDLDLAEEAFQEACLRALKSWPQNGPPRDPTAWLVLVGRNAAVDATRRHGRQAPLPDHDIAAEGDAEADMAERLDEQHYRDDVLRLLFICCHPELPATQQIALALRIVSGLGVAQIARAFLVSESAMEQRITRAKSRIAHARVPFETPGAVERAERLAAVAAMIYLVFNEGYSASHDGAAMRLQLADEAIRLARLLLRLFPAGPEIMGLTALLLLQHARTPARFDADGAVVLLEDQDRARGTVAMITEGLALIDKAMRHRRRGPYQVQAAIKRCSARRDAAGHRLAADRPALCGARAAHTLPGRHAQSRGRGRQAARAGSRARDDRAAGKIARRLFPFLRPQGRPCSSSSAATRKRASPSTGRSRTPTRRRRPRTSASISTGWRRRRPPRTGARA